MSNSEDFSLPAWAYTDPEFLALERERIFRPSWQVICHVSEIPKPGDYQSLRLHRRMLFALRGNDGQVRVFHNVCRHRAARLLDGPRGNCTRRIVCPYHAWSYDFEGKLASVGERSGLSASRHLARVAGAGRDGDLRGLRVRAHRRAAARASPR